MSSEDKRPSSSHCSTAETMAALARSSSISFSNLATNAFTAVKSCLMRSVSLKTSGNCLMRCKLGCVARFMCKTKLLICSGEHSFEFDSGSWALRGCGRPTHFGLEEKFFGAVHVAARLEVDKGDAVIPLLRVGIEEGQVVKPRSLSAMLWCSESQTWPLCPREDGIKDVRFTFSRVSLEISTETDLMTSWYSDVGTGSACSLLGEGKRTVSRDQAQQKGRYTKNNKRDLH